MAKKVAFLGLGVMGYPMAGWLSRKDYRVTVYNRTTATAERWCEEYSGDMADTAERRSAGCRDCFSLCGQ